MCPPGLPEPHADLCLLRKAELYVLADGLCAGDAWSVERCVDLVVADTGGHWHGRARAMMCRRLKHCALGRTHRTRLVEAIAQRMLSGRFSEQFRDQLRLAMQLDGDAMAATARKALDCRMNHVVRYAQWVLAHPRRVQGR